MLIPEDWFSAKPLRSKTFEAFWWGSLLSNIGTWMQSVAEPWLVLSLGGSSFLLGLDAFATNAPFWILALLGGVLADRRDRTLIIYVFQGIQMLCPALIVLLVAGGFIKVWMIIAISAVVGITDALSAPAFSSLIPSIVPSDDLGAALALNSIQFNLSRVLGPAVAGLVMLRYGFLWCFGANVASYIPLFLAVKWLTPTVKRAAPAMAPAENFRTTIRGIAHVAQHSNSRWALLSVLCTSLFCGPVLTFSPVIVKRLLHAGVGEFGGVLTAFGIGGMAGPVLILFAVKRVDPMKMSLIAAAVYGAFVIGVSRVGAIWELATLLVGCGFLLTVANTSANTYLQSQANDQTRGQTASLFMLATRGGLSLGNLITGTMIGFSSVPVVFLVNGLVAAGIQIFIFRRMRNGR